jgi:hypothetical protein
VDILARVVPRSLRGRSLLAVAVVVAMMGGTLSMTANANAEEGRRICEYSFQVRPSNDSQNNPRNKFPYNPSLTVSLGLDYKKNGACPDLDPEKLAETGYVDVDLVNPKTPANKWTCEEWGDKLQTALTSFGSDPCPNMWDDYVYAFMWQNPANPSALKPWVERLGNKWDYSY